MFCYEVQPRPVDGVEVTELGFTQAHRPFENRVENGSEISRRGIDDLQYLGRSGLLLQ